MQTDRYRGRRPQAQGRGGSVEGQAQGTGVRVKGVEYARNLDPGRIHNSPQFVARNDRQLSPHGFRNLAEVSGIDFESSVPGKIQVALEHVTAGTGLVIGKRDLDPALYAVSCEGECGIRRVKKRVRISR